MNAVKNKIVLRAVAGVFVINESRYVNNESVAPDF